MMPSNRHKLAEFAMMMTKSPCRNPQTIQLVTPSARIRNMLSERSPAFPAFLELRKVGDRGADCRIQGNNCVTLSRERPAISTQPQYIVPQIGIASSRHGPGALRRRTLLS